MSETREELFPKTLSRLLADTVKNTKKLLKRSISINQERKTCFYY